jgi:hypothetical protein
MMSRKNLKVGKVEELEERKCRPGEGENQE